MALCMKHLSEDLLLSLVINKSTYDGKLSYVRAFKEVSVNKYNIPFAFGLKNGYGKVECQSTHARPATNPPFRNSDQEAVYDEMLNQITTARACILAVHVGFGKTFLAIRLVAHLGLKALVVIPTSKKILQNQWKNEFKTFYPDISVQLLSSMDTIDDTANVYIVGTLSIKKLHTQLKERVKLVIVDEMHLALSDEGYKNLLLLFPMYLLGLSATPYRVDGTDKLVELFFGSHQVSRKLYREYFVKTIFTPFSFPLEKTEKGKVNWSKLLNTQAECVERNKFLTTIVVSNPNLKFLILCKRVAQIKDVRQMCLAMGVDIQAVYGNLLPIKDARSLIGHVSKLGVGFSDSSFNALLLGGDVQEYFIQYFGRVIREESSRPVIFDIVDSCHILRRHYSERERVYKESGGQIKEFRYSSTSI